MLLLSADEGLKVDAIGQPVGCQGQAVRQAIHAFAHEGLSCLQPKAKGNPTDRRALDDAARKQLRELIRRSPRTVGYETSLWTLDLLAQACYAQGITATHVTGETIRATLARWASTGGGPSSTSPARTRTTRSKKAARLAETAGTAASRLVVGGGR